MGMFTSGAYDAFKNRVEGHRSKRREARKEYQDWLVMQREAGIDVTSSGAISQWNTIADNNMHVQLGRPTRMEMEAQLKANNLVARDLRAQQEEASFQVQAATNNRWKAAVEQGYLNTNDTASAFSYASRQFDGTPAMQEGFQDYIKSIENPDAHRNAYLSGYMRDPNTQSLISSLVTDGVSDYAKYNPNAPQYIIDAFNPILQRKADVSMQTTAASIYATHTGNGTEISLEELIADMRLQKVNEETINNYRGRSDAFNLKYFDNAANTQLTSLLNNESSLITDATMQRLFSKVSPEMRELLKAERLDHNAKVQKSLDITKATTLKNTLTLKNESVASVVNNNTLTAEQRINTIMANLAFNPLADTVELEAVTNFVNNHMSSGTLVMSQKYEDMLAQKQVIADATAVGMQDKGDKALSTKLESIHSPKLNSTQTQILSRVIDGLEPYYVDPNDVTTLGKVHRQVRDDIADGTFSAEEMIARAGSMLPTDAQIRTELQRQAKFNSGPMPVHKFMRAWTKHTATFSTNVEAAFEHADNLLAMSINSAISDAGAITNEGTVMSRGLAESANNLMQLIKISVQNIQELRAAISSDNQGQFIDQYRIGENKTELDDLISAMLYHLDSAKTKLTKVNEKKRMVDEAISDTSPNANATNRNINQPSATQTGFSQDWSDIAVQTDLLATLKSTANAIATGADGGQSTSPLSQAWNYFFEKVSADQQAQISARTKVMEFLRSDKASTYLINNPDTLDLLKSDPAEWFIQAAKQVPQT